MTVQNESTAQTTHGVILTDAAATKAKSLLDQEGRDDLALRIAVQPGGCAGLRYNLFFDDRALDGDLTADFGGVTGYLTGSATSGRASGDEYGVTLGVSVPF